MTVRPDPDNEGGGRASRWIPIVLGIAAAALLVAIVVLHLTGTIGPGVH